MPSSSSLATQPDPIIRTAVSASLTPLLSFHSSYLVELSLPGVVLLRRLLLHAMVPPAAATDGHRCRSGMVLRRRLRLLVVVVSRVVRLVLLDLVGMELLMLVKWLLLWLLLWLLMHLHLLEMRVRVQALL